MKGMADKTRVMIYRHELFEAVSMKIDYCVFE